MSRLSFSISSSYHFSPWKNYNDALNTVVGSIQLNPYFIEPTGFFERISGDATVIGEIGYEILDQWKILLTGKYGSFTTRFESYPVPERLPSTYFSVAFRQKLSFGLWSSGVALRHDIVLKENLSIGLGFGLDRYTAQLKLDWKYDPFATGPIPEERPRGVSAALRENKLGWNISSEVSLQVLGPLCLVAGLEYRAVKFKNMNGSGTYSVSSSFQQPFEAELVEAPNYFGVRVKRMIDPRYSWLTLEPLTFLTEPDEKARVPATINLNSFGLRAGLKVQF